MKKFITLPVLIGYLLGQSGLEIAKMIDDRPTPKDMSNKTKMILTNSKGKTRTNTMVSKSIDGSKKQLIWFLEPKDDKGVAFLKIEHDDKDDESSLESCTNSNMSEYSSNLSDKEVMSNIFNFLQGLFISFSHQSGTIPQLLPSFLHRVHGHNRCCTSHDRSRSWPRS